MPSYPDRGVPPSVAINGFRSSGAKLQGHVVECPLHFACFDVRTGRLLAGPVPVDVGTYEIRHEG